MLTADVVTASVEKALARLREQVKRADPELTRLGLRGRLTVVERELERLTTAITAGGALPTLIEALTAREAERVQLRQELAVHDRATQAATLDTRLVEKDLRAKLDEWTALLRRQTPQARQVPQEATCRPDPLHPSSIGEDSVL